MKNRDKHILKVNEYDMLLRIHTSLYDNYNCVIEMLEGDYRYFKEMDGDLERCRQSEERKDEISCDECIQKWLNEEEETMNESKSKVFCSAEYCQKLKKTLRLAMSDLEDAEDCDSCMYDSKCCPGVAGDCKFKWKHHDEAMQLLGKENENDN